MPPEAGPGPIHDGLSGAAVVGFAADGHAIFLAPWQPAETLLHQTNDCQADKGALEEAEGPAR